MENRRSMEDELQFVRSVGLRTQQAIILNNGIALKFLPGKKLLIAAPQATSIRLEGEREKLQPTQGDIGLRTIGTGKAGNVIYIGDDEFKVTRTGFKFDRLSHTTSEVTLKIESREELVISRVGNNADIKQALRIHIHSVSSRKVSS